MRKYLAVLLTSLTLTTISINVAQADNTSTQAETKEWTFLVFINGNNNLDQFGAMNINQMEQVGSTKDVNMVVQWASLANKNTKRLLINKDSNLKAVTSPVVQNMGSVDMGDWRNLAEFIKWGAATYPAKHYFVTVWNHGSGWHAIKAMGNTRSGGIEPMDISWDDNTGHKITTQQLGMALSDAAKAIGHKIDVYASDACLMAMAEVANEVSDSVQVFAGSEEVEPGEGWPYDAFLRRWTATPKATPAEVATILTEEYAKAYDGGSYGRRDITFSAFDLSKMDEFNAAVNSLGKQLMTMDREERASIVEATYASLSFSFDDYVDLGDFLNQAKTTLRADLSGAVRHAMKEFVITTKNTGHYSRAEGVAIWLPNSHYTFKRHADKYKTLKFDSNTGWGDALQYVLQDDKNQ